MPPPTAISKPHGAVLPCDKPGTLICATRGLLIKSSDKMSQIQLAEMLDVPFHWLKSFMAGEINSPSVNRIQYIYEKLSGAKLIY